MKTVIIENNWLGSIERGWGNGYVLIPKGNLLHGKHYDDIDVDVHGGLTFPELVDEKMIEQWDCEHGLTKEDIGCWMVGFDTAHYRDNISRWPQEEVQKEADNLKDQLEKLSSTHFID